MFLQSIYFFFLGNIYTSEVLDRETSKRYWLTVFAQDRGAVPLHSHLHVYIEVQDENDNTPQTQVNTPPSILMLQGSYRPGKSGKIGEVILNERGLPILNNIQGVSERMDQCPALLPHV